MTIERRSEGTLRKPREQLPWPGDKPFKILSLDGGGIKGIFTASVLAEFERNYCSGRPIGNFFDLITGTSTGGIIALSLGMGHSAARAKELYVERGARVFPPVTGALAPVENFLRGVANLRQYRYERDPLETELRALFGDACLGDSERRLCIPSFDGHHGEVHVFKTDHHPDFKRDWRESAVDVALATAAAPAFFKVYESGDRKFADGGVWANNPAMIGLVDALTCFDVQRRQVQILSIGCGDPLRPFTKGQIAAGGLFHWRTIIEAAMSLQSQNAIGQAGLLIGRDQLIRLEPSESPSKVKMDDYLTAVAILPAEAKLCADANQAAVAHFFHDEADAYSAYYGPRL